MKNIIIIVILLLVIGCSPERNKSRDGKPIIVGKYYKERPCLCIFYYDGLGRETAEFTDSCRLYHIGDTIK